MEKSRQHNGKAKAPKVLQQSIIVKVDSQKHRRFKVKTTEHGTTMVSVIRKAIDQYLELST